MTHVNIRELLNKKLSLQLPIKEKMEVIVRFLTSHNMCVLATCANNVPRATPIEYYSEGTTIYLMTDEGTKLNNIRTNPVVSIGINDPLTDWLSIRGIQITGTARLIKDDNPDYWEAMKIYRWDNLGKDIGWTRPPHGYTIARIDSDRVEYLDLSLKLRGYSEKQIWERHTPEVNQ